MDENLRVYSRQLMARLKNKEEDFADLQKRFSKLQGRCDQLDYAFKKNLQLHQQQMIEIYAFRRSQKELRKVEEDRWKEFCELENQLKQVTNEKEVSKNELAYWKQSVIDQKEFYESKYEECVREWKLRIEADARVHHKTLRETQNLSVKHIQEMAKRWKFDNETAMDLRRKTIILQGDIDVLMHRTKELVRLIENCPGMDEHLKTIGSYIVKVLRSISISHHDYDDRMKELHRALLQQIPHSRIKPEEYICDYETLKSQNFVLREVVKKLKNELTKVQKSGVIVSNPLQETHPEVVELSKKLTQSNLENKKLSNLLEEKDTELRKLEINTKKTVSKLERNLKSMKSKENKEPEIFPKTNYHSDNSTTSNKAVQMDKEPVSYFQSQEKCRGFDDKSKKAFRRLQEGRVEKFEEQDTRDMTKTFELNLEPLNSGQSSGKNDATLEDEHKIDENNGSYLNGRKKTHFPFSQEKFEPMESHLNSIRYNEYTISFSRDHNLKIRHPIAKGSNGKLFRFRTIYSEEEYQSTPIDEAVLYFDFENCDTVFIKSKMANCAVQTLPIPSANVFTQTTTSKETSNGQTNIGVKILNSERRAVERSLRDLEKTISEASQETLRHARSLIVNTRKFPPSEEFFDCVKYLSQYETT